MVKEIETRIPGIYCPFCGANSNNHGQWLGGGKIKCLRCGKILSRLQYFICQFREFREDGWPLCPNCGEDELWSGLPDKPDGLEPTIEECIESGLACLNCGWNSMDASKKLPMVRKTTRCTVCYEEFSDSGIQGVTHCPNCGTKAKPHAMKDDVNLTLNWHELRILAQCVDAFLMLNPNDKSKEVLEAILERLKKYQPEGTLPLTLIDVVKETFEERGVLELIADENVKVPPGLVWKIV